jgi:prepilin-type N-terminal cleavage/methylation domain-containing protein
MRLSAHCTATGFGLARSKRSGFTLVEVMVALVICVVFGAAAFATNSQLLAGLKSQKETTAATMLLQRRMEELRASAWSNIATSSYLQSSIISNPAPDNPNLTQDQIAAYLAGIQNAEAPLSDLSEKITVTIYPPPLVGATTGVAERNSSYPTGHILSYISGNSAETPSTVYTYLTSTKNATLLRVDILLSWDGTSGRAARRSRQLSSIFGIGNSAP